MVPIYRNSHIVFIRISSKPALHQPQTPVVWPYKPLSKEAQFKETAPFGVLLLGPVLNPSRVQARPGFEQEEDLRHRAGAPMRHTDLGAFKRAL